MKTIGGYQFPENLDEYQSWEPTTDYIGLAGRNPDMDGCILAVATTRCEGAWKVFYAIVPGKNFDDEYQRVLDIGTKLGEDLARCLFPRFKEIPYGR